MTVTVTPGNDGAGGRAAGRARSDGLLLDPDVTASYATRPGDARPGGYARGGGAAAVDRGRPSLAVDRATRRWVAGQARTQRAAATRAEDLLRDQDAPSPGE